MGERWVGIYLRMTKGAQMPRPAYAIILAATLSTAAAAAEEDDALIEEVVVTATLRGEDIRQVPSSISVVTDADIAARAAAHLDDVLGAVPNLNFAKGASRARFLQIRGIGERGQFEEPLNSSVGLIVDGVDLSGVGTVASLFDVEQVEVLHGPQGTLYGANALAGLINVVTRAPTDTAEGRLELTGGTYGTYGLGAVASGPLSERAEGRVVVRIDESDGFIDNDYLNRDDTDKLSDRTVRGRVSAAVSESTRLDLAAGFLDANNGYDAFSLDNDRTTLANEPGHDTQQTVYGTASLAATGSASVTARAHVGWAVSDIAYGYDADWVYPDFHPWGYAGTDDYLRDRSTLTGEVRLVSKPDGRILGGATDWVAGVYLLDQDVDLRRRSTFIDRDFTSDFGIRRLALFGQTETALGTNRSLTAGIRVERHSSSYSDNNGIGFDPEDTMVGGRVALDHELNAGAVLYGTIARGYKAGGFNADGTLPADLRVYDPETLVNYEAGVKTLAREGQLSLRLALFHMRRQDVQIESSLVRRLPDGSSEFIQYVGNAAEGTNSGLELDLEYLAGERATLFARVGLLRTEYRDFTTGDGEDYGGRDQAQAPGYQFNVGGELTFGDQGRFFARGDWEGRDEFYFSDNHNFQSDAYQLLHLSAGYRGDSWALRIWGKNIGDEDYFVRGFFFGNDPRDGYTDRGFTQLGAPRRFGITVTRDW